MKNHYSRLKLKLQTNGALQPAAWEMIQSQIHVDLLAIGDGLVRDNNGISFLAEGVLKEYDVVRRKQPHIVHFLMQGDFFYHSTHHCKRYVKAITPSVVYSLNQHQLQLLPAVFKELRPIYDKVCENYDEQLTQRSRLLEMVFTERIQYFKSSFAVILPYLKKKDIAQYLSISYNYLIETWKL